MDAFKDFCIFLKFSKLNNKKSNNLIEQWGKDLNRHFCKEVKMVNGHMKSAHSGLEHSTVCKVFALYGTTLVIPLAAHIIP